MFGMVGFGGGAYDRAMVGFGFGVGGFVMIRIWLGWGLIVEFFSDPIEPQGFQCSSEPGIEDEGLAIVHYCLRVIIRIGSDDVLT